MKVTSAKETDEKRPDGVIGKAEKVVLYSLAALGLLHMITEGLSYAGLM